VGEFTISEIHKRKISEGMRRNYESPAFRERQKRRTREVVNRPEVKERHRKAMRDWWAKRKAVKGRD
jgi:hypothetical protein